VTAFPRDLTKLTPEQALRLLDSANKELAERHLYEFVKLLWPVIEPSRPFVEGWAIGAICEHLQAISEGEIKRLIINVPPGFSKSLCSSVFWPAWEWGPKNQASMRYIAASYSSDLTVRDNVRCRSLIMSPNYQKFWSDRFQISGDQFTKVKFANDRTGWKLATSVSGVGTGERGDRFIMDDPNSVKEAESEAVLGSTNQWALEVVPTRLNDPDKSAIMLIQQRTNEADVTGTYLSRELGYEHLMIPMRFEPPRKCYTGIDWEDPREREGELAWPERFPEHVVDDLEAVMGPYASSGQFQQSPSPRGGGIIKRDWWQLWPPEGQEAAWQIPVEVEDQVTGDIKTVYRNTFPDFEYIIASCDTAYTEKQENDYSACVVLGVFRDHKQHPKIMLIQAWQERLELHALVNKILRTCEKRGCDAVVVEAKASGKSVAQEIRRLMRPGAFNVTEYDPKNGDKVARMYAVQPLFSAGTVYAPDTSWAESVIAQTETFPKGAHDDLCDALAQGLQYLRKRGLAQLTYEAEEDDVRARTFRGKSEAVRDSYGV
jgi:predicted phage terminase large subunit-like protein